MFSGWWAVFCRPFGGSRDHFVSVDARRFSDQRNYEMLTSPPQTYHLIKGATGLMAIAKQPTEAESFPIQDHTGSLEASYHRTTHSFSQPRPASSRVTFSRAEEMPKPTSRTTTSPVERYRHGDAAEKRAGSALERDRPSFRPATEPTPHRSNSAFGRDATAFTQVGALDTDRKEWSGGYRATGTRGFETPRDK